MKKKSIVSVLLMVLMFSVSFKVTSQTLIVANDDYFTITNPTIVPPGISPVTINDQINGAPINLNQVDITLLNSPTPLITLDMEGSVVANSQTPNGVYVLQYQVCIRTDPNNCATANVTVTVDFCRATTPIIDSVIQPTCSNPTGSVTLSGLPEVGTWTMSVMNQYGGTVFGGTGTTFTIDNLGPETYTIHVAAEDILMGGCFESFDVYATINPLTILNSTMTGTYVDYNNDGFTNVGDIISYQFQLDAVAACASQQVTIASNSISITGSPVTIVPGETIDTIVGTYVITQNDINAGYVYETASVFSNVYNGFVQSNTPLNLSDGIKLHAFLDANANGIQDNSEQDFVGGEFHYEINNDGIVNNVASSNGLHFIYESNPLNSYHLSYTLNGQYATYYNLTTPSYSDISIVNGSGITEYFFPVTVTNYNDAAIQLCSYTTPPRPGFTYQNFISYTNNGNLPITSGTVTFVKDPALTITSVSQTGTVATAEGFTFDFVNLLPGQTQYMTVYMQVPTIPTVSLGQQVTNSCSISIPTEDESPSNNYSSLTQSIIGSYDPNDKSESHGNHVLFSSFTANDYLTYTIRFENTGTASAINIKVDDLLDAKLDETTVQTISASHPFVLKRINNALTWSFEGIDLPPAVANDDVTGHGYVIFHVKPKSGFALGDVIPNTANIFFDFNPPITTNTWSTEFVPTLGINAFENNTFEYFPNPTSDVVTFNLKNTSTTIQTIEVMDLLGKTLLTKTNNYSNASIDLSSLAKGMYLVKVKADGQEKTVKITKN